MRFTAPDDIPLSTASGRESGYLAVHVDKGMEYETYFRGVEDIMNELEGRPHWGKLHFQTADAGDAVSGMGGFQGRSRAPRPRWAISRTRIRIAYSATGL